MIVIAIIGILAAIALPAYARYMARARFTEVVQAVDGVKKQVELCIFASGTTFTLNAPVAMAKDGEKALTCKNGSSGDGFRIGANTDYATKYVATIDVADNGTITATARATNGLNSATYTIQPFFGAVDNGVIDWVKADGIVHAPHTAAATPLSTCIAADLC